MSCRAGEDTCNCLPSCDEADYYDEVAAGSSVEIGEPVVNFYGDAVNMSFKIPIVMRGMMAANYLKWRKENGYE